MGRNNRYILPFFIPHRGCPHRCIFCDQVQVTGAQAPTAQEIAAAISAWQGATLPEIAFYGGSFTALPVAEQAYYLDVTARAFQEGRIAGVRVSTRPDAISLEALAFLRRYNVDMVELGIQSLEDNVLQKAERGHSAAQSLTAARLLRESGFHWGVQLMPGLPGEDKNKVLPLAAKLFSFGPDTLRLYPTLVLAGTPLAKLWQAGHYQPLSLTEAVAVCRDLTILAEYYGVQVIRTGLQPTEEITWGKAICAGPFHPAFGDLVVSALWRQKGDWLLKQLPDLQIFLLAPQDVAPFIGHKRLNWQIWRKSKPSLQWQKQDDMARGALGGRSPSGDVFLTHEEFIQTQTAAFPFELPARS